MRNYPEPLFYDVFMDLGGGESRKLLPVPTLVYNQQYNGRFINQGGIVVFIVCVLLCICVHCFDMFCVCTESMKNWYLSRRMFLVDALSGREKSSPPKVIRVASSVKIRRVS